MHKQQRRTSALEQVWELGRLPRKPLLDLGLVTIRMEDLKDQDGKRVVVGHTLYVTCQDM